MMFIKANAVEVVIIHTEHAVNPCFIVLIPQSDDLIDREDSNQRTGFHEFPWFDGRTKFDGDFFDRQKTQLTTAPVMKTLSKLNQSVSIATGPRKILVSRMQHASTDSITNCIENESYQPH